MFTIDFGNVLDNYNYFNSFVARNKVLFTKLSIFCRKYAIYEECFANNDFYNSLLPFFFVNQWNGNYGFGYIIQIVRMCSI